MATALATAFPEQLDPSEATAILASAGSVARIEYFESRPTEDLLIDLLQGAHALIAGGEAITERVLLAAPLLKVIARTGVGVDNIDLQAAHRLGVRVTITPGLTSAAVADLTMGLLLCLVRRIHLHDRALRSGRWEQSIDLDLQGKTLGIIGLGAIGRLVARRALAFDMHVIAHDPLPDTAFAAAHGISCVTREQLLAQSDVVSLHAPLTPDTRRMIGEQELCAMRPTACLINTARGGLLDEPALVEALRRGAIAGAALDVFVQEPPVHSPLLGLPNVVLTPHIGAWTEHTWAAMARQAALEVVRALRGEPPLNSVE